MRARFLQHFPYMERIQGVLDGVRRGLVGPPGPLELAALADAWNASRIRATDAPRAPGCSLIDAPASIDASIASAFRDAARRCPGPKPPFSGC